MEEKNHHYQARINRWLENFLDTQYPAPEVAAKRLLDAVSYALLGGGKRIRPLLTYATAEAIDVPSAQVDAIAGAVEMIHAYSLVHDDLPAMDDDDLRRGRPTCHLAFDEATAILAGDALQALAFEALNLVQADSAIVLRLVHHLARACGVCGMAGGQALDLESENRRITQEQLDQLHALKTGALINAAMSMSANLNPHLTPQHHLGITNFARHFGLAFQIMDDVLDVTGDTHTLGKPIGSDQDNNKATYPQLLGLKQSLDSAWKHAQQAMTAINDLPGNPNYLRYLAGWVVNRQH